MATQFTAPSPVASLLAMLQPLPLLDGADPEQPDPVEWREDPELEDPFRTCAYGHHMYRFVGPGPDGSDESAEYRCEDCGSTDPEGDSAPPIATVDTDAEIAAEQKLTLRDCVHTIEDIVEAMDDQHLTHEVREALAEALIGAIAGTHEKVDRCGSVFAMYEWVAEGVEAEISRLNERLAWARRQHARLSEYVTAVMVASDLTKLDGRTAAFALRKNPPRIEIAEGAVIPDPYLTYPPPPAPRPNKDMLKRALKAGTAIAGVELRQSQRLVRS